MNKIIRDQLKMCRVAEIPDFEDSATHICIKRINHLSANDMQANHIYIIKVKQAVKTNKTLAANWNGGAYPKYDYYKVERVGVVGEMVKFNGIAYDKDRDVNLYSEAFYGYLPMDGFEILEEV